MDFAIQEDQRLLIALREMLDSGSLPTLNYEILPGGLPRNPMTPEHIKDAYESLTDQQWDDAEKNASETLQRLITGMSAVLHGANVYIANSAILMLLKFSIRQDVDAAEKEGLPIDDMEKAVDLIEQLEEHLGPMMHAACAMMAINKE